jgi:hypothetical protein
MPLTEEYVADQVRLYNLLNSREPLLQPLVLLAVVPDRAGLRSLGRGFNLLYPSPAGPLPAAV